MKLKNNLIFFILLLAPVFLVYRAFFMPGPLAQGDAPYYTSEMLKTLLSEPYSWANQSVAGFGSVNNLYWIFPISFAFGLLHELFGFSTDTLIRLLFYLPALGFSIVSPILLAKHLKYSRITQVVASIVYTFNTSFILLVDGGQVGVALAYGVFPLAVLYLRKLISTPGFFQFYKSLGVFMFLVVADARIAIIAFITTMIWWSIEVLTKVESISKKQIQTFGLFCICIVGLSSYWLYPALNLLSGDYSLGERPLELLSLLNSLTLFQPHWPQNEFGKVSSVPFYFIGIPVLIFGSLLIKKRNIYIYSLLFLLFAFFSKGTTPPLGEIYNTFIEKVPLGAAFRDSSKFLIPSIMFASMLIGIAGDSLYNLISTKSRTLGKVALISVIAYLLFLVSPALMGQMKNVLSGKNLTTEFAGVNKLLEESGDFRSAWFIEDHPYAFSTFRKPALDARVLIKARPFATLNVGTFDSFNFLNNPFSAEWLRIFGIKHLVFSGDSRITQNQEEKQNWDKLLNLVGSNKEFLTVPGIQIPTYQVSGPLPRIYGVQKAYFVIGSDNIYEKFADKIPGFSPANQAFIFLEDGKTNPEKILEIPQNHALVVFNGKSQIDLTLSLLQQYFISPSKQQSEWAIRSSKDYLKWKYELLTKGINTKEFDYGKGIAFSTKKGEKLCFLFNIPSSGKYVMATRFMDIQTGQFRWEVHTNQEIQEGKDEKCFITNSEVEAANVIAIIPQAEYDKATNVTTEIVGKFPTVVVNDEKIQGQESLTNDKPIDLNFSYKSPVEYDLTYINPTIRWVVFTDTYHPMWKMKNGSVYSESFPLYSAVNGFFIKDSANQAEIVFEGQKEVQKGLYYSGIAIAILGAVFIGKIAHEHISRKNI